MMSKSIGLPILVELAFCSHCGINPGTKPESDNTPPNPSPEGNNNSCVWHGFYDADTSEYVCWKCYDVHYQKKRNTEFRGCYSEMPVTIAAVTDAPIRPVNGTAIDSNKLSSSDPSSESSPLIDLSKLR